MITKEEMIIKMVLEALVGIVIAKGLEKME